MTLLWDQYHGTTMGPFLWDQSQDQSSGLRVGCHRTAVGLPWDSATDQSNGSSGQSQFAYFPKGKRGRKTDDDVKLLFITVLPVIRRGLVNAISSTVVLCYVKCVYVHCCVVVLFDHFVNDRR